METFTAQARFCMLTFALHQRFGDFQLSAEGSLPDHGITAVFGPSGSGKSLLLRCLAGLNQVPAGRVQFGAELWQADRNWVPLERRRVGLILQHPSLLPHLSGSDNLLFGFRRAKDRRIQPEEVIERLDLRPLLQQAVTSLSGGQQQRLVLGRALLANPQLLLLDEPVSALDRSARLSALRELRDIHRQWQIPMLYVSHDAEELERVADTVAIMRKGQIAAAQSVFDVSRDSRSPLRADLGPGVLVDGELLPPDATHPSWRARCGDWVMHVPTPHQNGRPTVRVRIAAREVGLARQIPTQTSFQNIVEVSIDDLELTRPGTVLVRCRSVLGHDLLAEVTEDSCHRLALERGQSAYAIFKASALDF